MNLSSTERKALATLGAGRHANVCFETFCSLASAALVSEHATDGQSTLGLMTIEPSDLIGDGVTIAGMLAAKEELKRVARNAAARGRNDALRSVGMRCTRTGGWE